MSSLFEIKEELLMLADMDDEGEESLQEAIKTAIDDANLDLDDKVDGICHVLATITGDTLIIDAEVKRLQARKKSIAKQQVNLKNYLLNNLDELGKKSVKTKLFSVSSRIGSKSVVIDDESKVPSAYVTTKFTETIDKNEVKKALKSGKVIDGCHIERGNNSLVIK